VYKCISCDYLFGNLSDLKRHLKIRHHIQVQEIAGMEQMQISEVEVRYVYLYASSSSSVEWTGFLARSEVQPGSL
jgi:hypothetical protein